jgi:hypothetical protein
LLNGEPAADNLQATMTGVTGVGLNIWTATLPSQSAGTTVSWFAFGTDTCHSGTDYYSNGGTRHVEDKGRPPLTAAAMRRPTAARRVLLFEGERSSR